MPRLRSGLDTEVMASLLTESLPSSSSAKTLVDAEMADLEKEFKIYNDKANTSQVYLNLLIKSYQDQIATLKEELKEKNNVIFDILYATSSTVKRGQTIDEPVVPQTIAAKPMCINDSNKSIKWNSPKKTVKIKDVKKNFGTETIETSNRFNSLADNEWVKSYDDGSVFDECLSSGIYSEQSPFSISKRRPNVVVEENPERNSSSPYRKEKNSGKRSVAILGDSMVRNIRHWKVGKLCPKDKIYVKSFPGADVQDMAHYSLPTAKRNPDVIFVHCGTNDLKNSSSENPEILAQDIIHLASTLKTDTNEVIVSSIICRSDEESMKVQPVNEVLYKMCRELSLGFMDNSNIKEEHLSTRGKFPGLHLNECGNSILFSNFINFINM